MKGYIKELEEEISEMKLQMTQAQHSSREIAELKK